MKKTINIMINLIFFTLTMLYMYINKPLNDNLIMINNAFLLIFIFVLIHIIKCFRQYLLLIESGIHLGEFVKVYVKTTFCSIVLPYKSGEIYKAYEYGYIVNNYMKGLLTVVVDKVLDAILLLFFFIPYEIRYKNELSAITWIILSFAVIFFIIYIGFNTTYYYLNKHFIKKSNEKRNIYALKFLEQGHELFDYVNGLIKGRILLLLIFTVIAWALEWVFMYILDGGHFIDYINAVFFGNQSNIFSNYVILGIVCFVVFELALFIRKCGSNK